MGVIRTAIISIIMVLPTLCKAQIGGTFTFDFLSIAPNARTAGLGGQNISSSHRDASMFLTNPALLEDSVLKYASLNLCGYYDGTTLSTLTYAMEIGKSGRWGIGLQRIGYGEMDGFDPSGNSTGSFTARDVAITLTKSHKLGPFAVGGSIKIAQSSIDSYRSSAFLFDFGGAFIHPEKDLKVALTFRNNGFVLQHYSPTATGQMPNDLLLGATFKPDQMPLRFSVTMHQLHRFLGIGYDDPRENQTVNLFGEVETTELGFADKLSRHFVLATEVAVSRGFNLRLGYNFLQRSELKLDDLAGMTGFSMGLMIRVKRLELAYSRSWAHVAGGANMFTFALDTDTFFRKKAKKLLE